jgi:hypothetical protein
MRFLERSVVEVDPKQYIRRNAVPADCKFHIDEPTTIVDPDGKPLVVYDVVECDAMANARHAITKIKYEKSTRGIGNRGMTCHSKVFGYAPRDGRRRQPCRSVAAHQTDRGPANEMVKCASFIDDWYRGHLEEEHQNHLESVADVKDDWRIGDTVFTSGIANYNNAIEYHWDSGNFKGCSSVMIGFRQSATGGYLCIPELETSLEISDYSITAFDGQSLIHGVTPITVTRKGFRATAVYYSLRKMWRCKPIDEELLHHRKQMTELAINPYWKRNQSDST